mgnify:FL=1
MSKFKVGDKVAYVTKPDEEIGEVNCIVEDRYGCHVFVAFNKKKVYEMQLVGYNYDENKLVKIDEYALSDDEIYAMLDQKMKNSNVWNHGYRVVAYNDGYHLVREDNDTINAIALAYRSGYLRAKKGRPFKIGGEKD